MARVCKICTHPEREAIDRALLSGTPLRDIAGQHGVSRSTLDRHKAAHLPSTLAQAKQAEEIAAADRLITELNGLKGKAVALLLAAEKAGDLRTALAGVREARGCIETLLEVEGEIDRRAQVNVLVANPEWLRIQAVVLQALAAHPEARESVVEALQEVRADAA